MRDTAAAKRRERVPEAAERGAVGGGQLRQRLDGSSQDEQRVSSQRRSRLDDLPRRHAGLRREQRDESLVLDCLDATEPRCRAAVLVPQRPPEGREQLVVVRVPAVHLDDERPAALVPRVQLEDARDLTLGRLEPGRADAELLEGRRHVRHSRTPERGAEREPDGRGRRDCDEDRSRGSARHRGMQHQAAEQAEPEEPVTDALEAPDELGSDRQHDRARLGHARDGNGRRVRAADDRAADVGPVAEREPGRHDRERGGDGERRHGQHQHPDATADADEDDQDDRPQGEEVEEESPDRIEPVREAPEERREGSLEVAGRVGDDEEAEPGQRRDQDEHVGRAARRRPARRRRVEVGPPRRGGDLAPRLRVGAHGAVGRRGTQRGRRGGRRTRSPSSARVEPWWRSARGSRRPGWRSGERCP